jgi:hypothetical protein
MVISLFETGYLAAGAGLFEADAGHLHTSGMATRLADAMRRGALTLMREVFPGTERRGEISGNAILLPSAAPRGCLASGRLTPGGITSASRPQILVSVWPRNGLTAVLGLATAPRCDESKFTGRQLRPF